MKGLLLKDFYVAKRLWWFFVLFEVLFVMTSGSFVLSLVPVMSLTMNLFSYEHMSKWDKWVGSMPLSAKRIVGERYLCGILFMALTQIVGLPFMLLKPLVFPNGKSLGSQILGMLSMWIVFFIFQSILLPCIYRFGIEKGRIILFLATSAMSGIIGAFFVITLNEESTVSKFMMFEGANTFFSGMVYFVGAIIAGLLYVLSYFLSVRIYKRQDH